MAGTGWDPFQALEGYAAEDADLYGGPGLFDAEDRVCRGCGCDSRHACLGEDGVPCHWVEDDLCSVCAAAMGQQGVLSQQGGRVQAYSEAQMAAFLRERTLDPDGGGHGGWR